MVGNEQLGRIGLAKQVTDARDRDLGAVAPGARLRLARAHAQAERGGARIGPDGEPGLVRPQADGAVAEAVSQGAEGLSEVERAAQRNAALDHRRIESRIGLPPVCAASRSARVRMPR